MIHGVQRFNAAITALVRLACGQQYLRGSASNLVYILGLNPENQGWPSKTEFRFWRQRRCVGPEPKWKIDQEQLKMGNFKLREPGQTRLKPCHTPPAPFPPYKSAFDINGLYAVFEVSHPTLLLTFEFELLQAYGALCWLVSTSTARYALRCFHLSFALHLLSRYAFYTAVCWPFRLALLAVFLMCRCLGY